MIWVANGSALHADTRDVDGRTAYRLIVERLPEGMWDWTVWAARGTDPDPMLRSVARTVHEAMRAAEEPVPSSL